MSDIITGEIAHKVNQLTRSWEQFKSVNEARLADKKKDPLHDVQLEKIGNEMDNLRTEMKALEASIHRPAGASFKDSESADAYKQAFCSYVRKGADIGLAQLEKKALSVSSDPDGGYMVTPFMSQYIAKAVFDSSPLRRLARVETISTDSLDIIEDNAEAAAGWTAETASVSDTTTPTIGKRNIACHEIYAQPKATQKLVDDASINIEQWLAEKIADKFSRLENTAFVSGDGVGKPRGITTYADGTSYGQIQQVATGTSGDLDADSLLKLFYALKETYALRASFLMHRSTLQKVRLLKETSTGQYIWTPFLGDGQPETLLGIPVYSAVDMPTPASGSLSVALGDFQSAYQVVDRNGVRILRDPYTDKPFVKFYATKRVGGDVINFDAIKLLRFGA